MTSCPEVWAEDFEIWKKSVSWDSDLSEARRFCALRAPRVGWVESWRCKSSQHRKIDEKPLNSKRWIKVSYMNQFRVFGFLYMFTNILWTLCLFHISVSWVLSHIYIYVCVCVCVCDLVWLELMVYQPMWVIYEYIKYIWFVNTFSWSWALFFTQVNGFKYCYITLMILFNTSH